MSVVVFVVLVAVAVMGRVMEHAPNFAPVAAAALFAGFFFTRRAVAAAVPVVAMLVADVMVGFYEWPLMLAVYAAFTAPAFFLRRGVGVARIGLSAVAASVLFFVVSNAAVWAFTPWYDQTLSGLLSCFAAAAPFFRFTLLGDLMYSGVFFGGFALVTALRRAAAARLALA